MVKLIDDLEVFVQANFVYILEQTKDNQIKQINSERSKIRFVRLLTRAINNLNP